MRRVDFIPDKPIYARVRVWPTFGWPRLGLLSSDVLEVGRARLRDVAAWTADRRSGRPPRVPIVELRTGKQQWRGSQQRELNSRFSTWFTKTVLSGPIAE